MIWGKLENQYQVDGDLGFSAKSLPIWQTIWTWRKCVLLKRHGIRKKGFFLHLCSSFIFWNISSSLNLRKAFPSRQICSQHVQLGKRKTSSFWIWEKNHGRKNVSKILFKKSARKFLLFVVEDWFGSWPEASIKGCKWQCHAMIWSKRSSNSHPLPNSWEGAQNQMFRCFVAT